VEQLHRLPLLDKMTAIAHQHELVVGTAPAGFGIASSGTTRAEVDLPLLNVWRNDVEIEANHSEETEPGWVLVSISVNHGLPGHPGPNELFVPWMYDRNSLAMLETVLSRPQPDGRRVTTLRISTGALKVFTTWLLERNKKPAEFGVQVIGTNSFRLSPFWRQLVSDAFGGALIVDNYSLSEIETCASECLFCGWHHWFGPPLAVEVLDLSTGKPSRNGTGRLVVTTLLPAGRSMPLIRYDTGDVVAVGPKCKAEDTYGIRFLGRLRRGLVVGHDYLLSPTIVQDVLESRADTERNDHPCVKLGIIQSREVGLPRWTVSLEKKVAHLRFEVRFDPLIYAAQARELELQVGGEILHLDKRLHHLIKTKKLEFDVSAVRAQSLIPPPDKHD
jgi:hypothetical protein